MNRFTIPKQTFRKFLVTLICLSLLLILISCQTTETTWKPLYTTSDDVADVRFRKLKASQQSISYSPAIKDQKQEIKKVESKTTPPLDQQPSPVKENIYKDYIHTQDGKIYQGTILNENESMLYIRFPEGHFSIPQNQIKRIDRGGDATIIKFVEEDDSTTK